LNQKKNSCLIHQNKTAVFCKRRKKLDISTAICGPKIGNAFSPIPACIPDIIPASIQVKIIEPLFMTMMTAGNVWFKILNPDSFLGHVSSAQKNFTTPVLNCFSVLSLVQY